MSEPSATKQGLTLGWSIGLGVVLLVLTGAVLLPSTKRANINFDNRPGIEMEADRRTNPKEGAEGGFAQSEEESHAPKVTARAAESTQ